MSTNNSLILYVVYLILINLFGIFLNYFAYSDLFLCYACKELDSIDKYYDYIIVGSGSAGSIVANRLAQDPDLKILLLEAGSYGNRILDAPAMGVLLQKTIFDWQYQTVPQRQACLAYENNMCNWPMGRMIGGTSRLNNMIYLRGHRQDFADWYQNQSDYNYDDDILPYFKKLENSHRKSITIGDIPFLSDLSEAILSAAENFGFPITNSLDCDRGFSIPKITIKNGRRDTPSHRLFETKRTNLKVRNFAEVTKVLFRDNFEAYGVEYSYLNDNYRARASRGVILSAGVIGTPKILMLSGIGHEQHLKSVKIPMKINLPVGDNLQDHVTTGFDLFLLNRSLDMDFIQMLSPLSIYDYFIEASGRWTTVGCENLAFLTTTNTTIPNLQLMVLPMGVTSDNGLHLQKLIGLKSKIWLKYFDKINETAITILPIVTHPKSRGFIRLKNKNPKTRPLIDPRYFSDPSDIQTIIDGIYLIQKLIEMPALQGFGAKLNRLQFPSCGHYKFNTRSYWECYIRFLTVTSYHPIGTCAIGKVVDYDFRVYRTNRLYIVDGSILPSLPTGNPNGAIMMLAEKAVDIIKSHQYLNRKFCKSIEIFIPKLIC